jgi:phosphoglycolate phosphatase-like HAD superfamily hydrolase
MRTKTTSGWRIVISQACPSSKTQRLLNFIHVTHYTQVIEVSRTFGEEKMIPTYLLRCPESEISICLAQAVRFGIASLQQLGRI